MTRAANDSFFHVLKLISEQIWQFSLNSESVVGSCELKMKLIGIILVLSVSFAASLVIDCEFGSEPDSYYCVPISDWSITKRDTVVTTATGSHIGSRNDASVTAFETNLSSNTINYMPRLYHVFPNLDRILIQRSHLKEIRQTDLQPFSKLKVLGLYKNDIETIEIDLFKFNLQLQFINLSDNKIRRVDPNVFDHLNQLSHLFIDNNVCVSENAYFNRAKIRQLVIKIKKQCNAVDL
jgi:hypothetical protein